jgi:hypothetical protein
MASIVKGPYLQWPTPTSVIVMWETSETAAGEVTYWATRRVHSGLDGGVVYIVAGGAGAKPEWLHHKWAWHTAQAAAVPHFVQVVVAGPTLELRAVDLDGRPFDVARLIKRPSLL